MSDVTKEGTMDSTIKQFAFESADERPMWIDSYSRHRVNGMGQVEAMEEADLAIVMVRERSVGLNTPAHVEVLRELLTELEEEATAYVSPGMPYTLPLDQRSLDALLPLLRKAVGR